MVITEVVWVVHWKSSWDSCATTSCTIFGSERATELGTSPVGVECVGWRQAMYILTSSSIERGQPGCISGHQSIEPQLANVKAGIKTRSREATICLFLRLVLLKLTILRNATNSFQEYQTSLLFSHEYPFLCLCNLLFPLGVQVTPWSHALWLYISALSSTEPHVDYHHLLFNFFGSNTIS